MRVQLLDDIIGLWVKSDLPVLSRIRVETKLRYVAEVETCIEEGKEEQR